MELKAVTKSCYLSVGKVLNKTLIAQKVEN